MEDNKNKIEWLGEQIDAVLKEHSHTRDEIVCVLWGGGDDEITNRSISLNLKSFWKFAENTSWDRVDWVSGPPYPLALLSGKGWWIASTEYDSRTYLTFFEEPKVKPPLLSINEYGNLYDGKDEDNATQGE